MPTPPYAAIATRSGIYCFRRSCHACRELRLEDYRRWHVLWHFAFPCTMVIWYLAQFLAPQEAVSCTLSW